MRTVAETRRLSLVELAVVAMVARERPAAQTQEAVVAELLLKAAEAQVAAVLSSSATTGKGGKKMNYALIENGIVTNIIWLSYTNADDFPNAVAMGDLPVAIGDTWDGENFYRNGEKVVSALEQTQSELKTMVDEIPLLKAQVQALSDRGEFVEDCIAEMATVVYADEPTA